MILLYIFTAILLIGFTYYIINDEKFNNNIWYMHLKENQYFLYFGLIFIITLIYLFDMQISEFSCKDGYICFCVPK
jgi:hypothetical protein